jgi:hypothetical protein
MKQDTRKQTPARKRKGPTQQRKAEQRAGGTKAVRRLVPFGRHARAAAEGKAGSSREAPVHERALTSVQALGDRSRQTLSRLRERAPTGEQLRTQFGELRDWAKQGVASQPLAMGLGALALGFGAAALLPSSQLERRAFVYAAGAARQLDAALDTARQLAESAVEGEAARALPARILKGKKGPGGKSRPA